jgi:hypothetical protein
LTFVIKNEATFIFSQGYDSSGVGICYQHQGRGGSIIDVAGGGSGGGVGGGGGGAGSNYDHPFTFGDLPQPPPTIDLRMEMRAQKFLLIIAFIYFVCLLPLNVLK